MIRQAANDGLQPDDRHQTDPFSGPDRWFTRALRWPDGPTYANEVDAFAALWHLTTLELQDKAQTWKTAPELKVSRNDRRPGTELAARVAVADSNQHNRRGLHSAIADRIASRT